MNSTITLKFLNLTIIFKDNFPYNLHKLFKVSKSISDFYDGMILVLHNAIKNYSKNEKDKINHHWKLKKFLSIFSQTNLDDCKPF